MPECAEAFKTKDTIFEYKNLNNNQLSIYLALQTNG